MDNPSICTQCGFTWAEFRTQGLLGCPHCYQAFGEAMRAELAWLHGGSPQTAALPGIHPAASSSLPAPASPDQIAVWREQLADALRSERYRDASRLRDLLDGQGKGRAD